MVTRSLSCSSTSSHEDDVSVATTDSDGAPAGELALDGLSKEKPSFGNIAVSNSTDVHFGNKTYYQGPVTIKQFVYAKSNLSDEGNENLAIKDAVNVPNGVIVDDVDSGSLGKDNPVFVPDVIESKVINGINNAQNGKNHGGEQWFQNVTKHHLIAVLVVVVLLISLVTSMSVFFTKQQHPDIPTTTIPETNELSIGSPSPYPVDPDVNLTLPNKLWMVQRSEWLARPPKNPYTPLQLPVPIVIIMHTASESCNDQATCTFSVTSIQNFHMDSRGWDDIGYSFLVGGDGFAYEGRGWKNVGAQVYGYNVKCIGIAFIGTFNKIMPPERQIKAAKQLIEIGLKEGYIAKDYKLLAARQLQTTQSPGLLLYEDVKTWPHWASAP